MAIIRQMPALFLRGSIATVTMSNLTEQDIQFLNQMTDYVGNHPEMARNKSRMIKELGGTIRGDYADDRNSAEQEYNIAIWRGLVDLYYHCDYTFKCGHCQSQTYLTKRGKPKAIERQTVPCPNCGMAEVKDPGDADLKIGDIVPHADMQEAHKNLTHTPRYKSTIKYTAGPKKHQNPQAVVDCPKQLKKFFGEFVWNYFRQHIKENKRIEHKKRTVIIAGPADTMGVEQIKNICDRMKLDYEYNKLDGKHILSVNSLQAPPEFTIELALIRSTLEQHGIIVLCSNHSIDIKEDLNAPVIEVSVTKPEHVMVVDNNQNAGGDECESSFTINQVSHRTSGGAKMDQEDHVALLDMTEAAKKVRESLPDGDCKKIYDILSQNGDTYDGYSKNYGIGKPKTNHIAEFLGITTRQVKQHKESIKINCLAFDFHPKDK